VLAVATAATVKPFEKHYDKKLVYKPHPRMTFWRTVFATLVLSLRYHLQLSLKPLITIGKTTVGLLDETGLVEIVTFWFVIVFNLDLVFILGISIGELNTFEFIEK
jgi:hypothetical protein